MKVSIYLLSSAMLLSHTLYGKSIALDNNNKLITDRVSQEIGVHLRSMADINKDLGASSTKQPIKKGQQTEGLQKVRDKVLFPAWPFYANYFEGSDMLLCTFLATISSQGYKNNGDTANLSHVIFGASDIRVQDILLASKLIDQEKLVGTGVLSTPALVKNNDYLGILAHQPIIFRASLEQYSAQLQYARNFDSNKLTIGVNVPVMIQQQHLCIANDLTQENRQKLQNIQENLDAFGGNNGSGGVISQPANAFPPPVQFVNGVPATFDVGEQNKFFSHYASLEAFVDDLLSRKGMKLKKNDFTVGLGDSTLYVTAKLPLEGIRWALAGVYVQLPTSRATDSSKLWSQPLGVGITGFTQFAGYLSLFWEKYRALNPYMHFSGAFSLSDRRNYRVPVRDVLQGNVFNGKVLPTLLAKDHILFGESFLFDGDFSLPDSTVRGFPDQIHPVRITPGASFFCQAGNIIDGIFTTMDYFDLSYQFQFKGQDTVRPIDNKLPNLVTHVLEKDTSTMSHMVGLQYTYKCTDHFLVELGGLYVFAGRNVPRTFQIALTLEALW